ncbi:hypothetical protein [Paenibacillus dokdonensis]|uniref:hypothetical protein n=1 Tax=Paenibacillus dokdonensis TaxID=2567944 RepID=UPI0010A940E5|nr:hypothetical protein [Paenibacillus dokdonensis]
MISIPAGATNQELKLTIEKVLNTQLLLTNREVIVSPIFELMKNFPENFNKPVTLTFTFDPVSLKSDQTAAVFYYDEAKKIWIRVEGGRIKENRTDFYRFSQHRHLGTTCGRAGGSAGYDEGL